MSLSSNMALVLAIGPCIVQPEARELRALSMVVRDLAIGNLSRPSRPVLPCLINTIGSLIASKS